jgi:hypothetical protein
VDASDGNRSQGLRRVVASVQLRPEAERQEMLAAIEAAPPRAGEPAWLRKGAIDDLRARDQLELLVRLSAEDENGRLIAAPGCFGIAGPRRGLAAITHRYRGPKLSDDPDEEEEILQRTYRKQPSDIEDSINQMLGRDPELHRPPRLAWDNLIAALAEAGILASEDELIATALEMVLEPEVQRELARP